MREIILNDDTVEDDQEKGAACREPGLQHIIHEQTGDNMECKFRNMPPVFQAFH